MKYIKKLDLFVTRSFLMMLAGAFFVSLFVLMMQFTWRYIDELIGKGLTMDIFAQFFWYMALTVVPQAIPLAILLSSLISFGNMGERLELLAMKSAGIPLIRIMRPLIVIVTAIGGMSFYFQNVTSPNAEYQLRALLLSMHESAPALDIPEGAFYNGIPNVNLYVQKKENETGMLYNVIIYKTDRGFNKAQIVLADSAKLEITGDKHYLKLQLYSGEQFENLDASSTGRLNAYIPYDRETFAYKQLYIEFDSNFNVLDADAIGNRPESRNMAELVVGVDSMETYADSLGKANYAIVAKEGGLGTIPALNRYHNDAPKQTPAKTAAKTPAAATQAPAAKAEKKTAAPAQAAKPDKSSAEVPVTKIDIDSLFSSLSAEQKTSVINKTREKAGRVETELEWQRYEVLDIDLNMRKYMIAWHNKILLSLTCIIFFFVGAPLGSIIQKGGLGLPTVVSVIIFILYYIISTSGMKLAKEGTWEIWFGMWISAEFKIYLIREFQRLKEEEQQRLSLEWNLQRTLAKLNYRIHTDAVKEHILPPTITKEQASFAYASEADLLNVALFGKTAQQWRKENPKEKGNMRDYASLEQLIVLSNIESINALLISQKIPQEERLVQLNNVAIAQMKSLLGSQHIQAIAALDTK